MTSTRRTASTVRRSELIEDAYGNPAYVNKAVPFHTEGKGDFIKFTIEQTVGSDKGRIQVRTTPADQIIRVFV